MVSHNSETTEKVRNVKVTPGVRAGPTHNCLLLRALGLNRPIIQAKTQRSTQEKETRSLQNRHFPFDIGEKREYPNKKTSFRDPATRTSCYLRREDKAVKLKMN